MTTPPDPSSRQGLIATVGGAPEPIVHSILAEPRPRFVLFVVSNRSNSEVKSRIVPQLSGNSPRYECLTLSDEEDLGKCYAEIRARIPRWLADSELAPEGVRVNITGGTKAMSAALAIAGMEYFRDFVYVGGTKRDKGGLGVVESGHEKTIQTRNPWDEYAVVALERANRLLNGFHAEEAAETLRDAATRCGDAQRERILAFAELADDLAAADGFDFKTATKPISPALKRVETLNGERFAGLSSLRRRWRAVRDQTRNNSATPGPETLHELIANADRRAAQGRYDDAAGRLYRAVELRGQQLIQRAFAVEFGRFRLDELPAESREAFVGRFGHPRNHVYLLGVQDLYAALEFAPDESLRAFSGVGKTLANHLQKRNNSLLAHGSRPVSRKDYDEFRSAAIAALGMTEADILQWPRIAFELP